MEILLGTDPEMFIFDKSKGHIISGHDLVPGTKTRPMFIENGAVQLDGVAAEFNIFPASTAEEFVEYIQSVQKSLTEIIRHMADMAGHKDPSALSLVAEPTAYFTKEYFDTVPQSAKALGCQPDFNAWTGKMQAPSASKTDKVAPFRTGGFHIHVGWTSEADCHPKKAHFQDALNMAKQLDTAIFIPSTLWDDDDKRRELYGSRGSFRPKHYGMEYRSLSNAALNDVEILTWLFDTSVHAAELLFDEIMIFEEVYHDVDQVDPVEFNYMLSDMYDFPVLPEKYLVRKAA